MFSVREKWCCETVSRCLARALPRYKHHRSQARENCPRVEKPCCQQGLPFEAASLMADGLVHINLAPMVLLERHGHTLDRLETRYKVDSQALFHMRLSAEHEQVCSVKATASAAWSVSAELNNT